MTEDRDEQLRRHHERAQEKSRPDAPDPERDASLDERRRDILRRIEKIRQDQGTLPSPQLPPLPNPPGRPGNGNGNGSSR